MSHKKYSRSDKALIANEAARILSEQSDLNLSQAKRKAAQQLGFGSKAPLPDDNDVESALKTYQQLFQVNSQPSQLLQLRKQALEAMEALKEFHPRLVGGLKTGIANTHSPIQLQLFCETPEEVNFHLIDLNIPWRDGEATCHYSRKRSLRHPLISFRAGETKIELLILPITDRHHPPLNALNGTPEKGLSIKELKILLA